MSNDSSENRDQFEQVKLLFEYTKFHIGVYLTAAASLIALINTDFGKRIRLPEKLIWAAVIFMALAGLAGGIVASTLPHCQTLKQFWERRVGPFRLQWFKGEIWTYIEHSAFWLSIGAVMLAFLCRTPMVTQVVAKACEGPREMREATLASIKEFIDTRQMTVLTFGGYSGAQYEAPDALMGHASRVLDGHVPAKTLVNIGATAEGIGAVYEIAKQKGFTTMGIVSTLARDEHVALSKCVDYVFFVEDSSWGGRVPGADRLSATSAAIVETGTSFVAIGGGDVTRDEMLAARQAGKAVSFIPADMNHKIARDRALKRGEAEPTDFRGSAHGAIASPGQ